ncbi:MAG TPA: MFS transporter [Isosphaeraceae bacterium]|jgi:MFS family permease|nr:MFS transporter [Isosphaeraceae bacterium]
MNPRRLFIASCISLIASAFSFVIRQDVLPAWGHSFKLSATQLGFIGGLAFWGMACSMAVGSFIVDFFGMKKMLGLAFLCHLVGTVMTMATPYLSGMGLAPFGLLCVATFLVGSANGFVEIGINPLAATIYPTKKTHMLNVLHAWWPGGLMIGGVLSVVITKALGLGLGGAGTTTAATIFGWQVKMVLILIPTIVYGVLFFTETFPVTERVASGVSTSEMLGQALRPMFLLWAFCMLLTASTELAPQGMQSLVLEKTAGMNGTFILIYTSAMMFTLRHFAGPIAHRLSPVGMLVGSSVLSAIGLYALSFAYNFPTAIAAATIYGLGIVYFWPTMLGVTAERFPRGGAFLLGLMGCVGNLAIGVVQPFMGGINDRITLENIPADVRDRVVVKGVIDPGPVKALPESQQVAVLEAQKEGAKWSFRYVSALPVVLVVIFGGIALYDRSRGGYRPEVLKSEDNELSPAELASDY